MLDTFDWIRRCETGGELLATLDHFQDRAPDRFPEKKALAPPPSLGEAPCCRCWLFPSHGPAAADGSRYCRVCTAVLTRARVLGRQSCHACVIWGHLNQLPEKMDRRAGFYSRDRVRCHVRDAHHFLLVMESRKLKEWIHELMLYHGSRLTGLLQVFPTSGRMRTGNMGELVCRAAHHDARFPMDCLRIRSYTKPVNLLFPHRFEEGEIVTREVPGFLKLLDMAHIFRSILKRDEQRMVREIAGVDGSDEGRFMWGRLMGVLPPRARDMLDAWGIRQWSPHQINTLYRFMDYVEYTA